MKDHSSSRENGGEAAAALQAAEIETWKLGLRGRALRALSDISRPAHGGDRTFETLDRADMSALFEVLSESILQSTAEVDRLIARAGRRPVPL